MFGLATGNEDLPLDPEAAAAPQQLCSLCVQPEDVFMVPLTVHHRVTNETCTLIVY